MLGHVAANLMDKPIASVTTKPTGNFISDRARPQT